MANGQGPDRELADHVERVILPLIAVASDARWHPLGSAFVVSVFAPSQALVITATHCLKEFLRLEPPNRATAANIVHGFEPLEASSIQVRKTRLLVGVQGPREFVLAKVIKSWHAWNLDVAFCLVQIPDDCPATFTGSLAVDMRPVDVGTLVSAFGYPSMKAEFTQPPDYETEDFRISFQKRLVQRNGSVVAVHPQGISIHKWPGFLVDFGLDSGMSGGPLIEFRGSEVLVRGVVGGDVSEDAANGRSGSGVQAFASFLWPALATAMELDIRMPGSAAPHRVARGLDLTRLGVIVDAANSGSNVVVEKAASGETVRWLTK